MCAIKPNRKDYIKGLNPEYPWCYSLMEGWGFQMAFLYGQVVSLSLFRSFSFDIPHQDLLLYCSFPVIHDFGTILTQVSKIYFQAFWYYQCTILLEFAASICYYIVTSYWLCYEMFYHDPLDLSIKVFWVVAQWQNVLVNVFYYYW